MGLTPPGILTQTLTVLRGTPMPNGAGGFTNSYASVGTVRGRITALRSRRLEQMVADQPVDADIVEIYADDYVAIKNQDRIEGPDGKQYEIVALQHQDTLVFMAGRAV